MLISLFPIPFDHFHSLQLRQVHKAKKFKNVKKEKDNVVPTRSNRCEYYQYGQTLQTSLSQGPPQFPYHIIELMIHKIVKYTYFCKDFYYQKKYTGW